MTILDGLSFITPNYASNAMESKIILSPRHPATIPLGHMIFLPRPSLQVRLGRKTMAGSKTLNVKDRHRRLSWCWLCCHVFIALAGEPMALTSLISLFLYVAV